MVEMQGPGVRRGHSRGHELHCSEESPDLCQGLTEAPGAPQTGSLLRLGQGFPAQHSTQSQQCHKHGDSESTSQPPGKEQHP